MSSRSLSGRSKGKGFFRGNDHTTEDNCHTLVRSRIASISASDLRGASVDFGSLGLHMAE